MCIIFLSLLLNLNNWVIKVESINCYALPLNLFKFPCFHLFKENSWDSLALLSSSPVWSIHSLNLKHKNDFLPCPNQNSVETVPHPEPNLPFPVSSTKPPKTQIKPLYFIPSLKLAFISVISRPITCLFPRSTQREPSLVFVGLATRLSVVWCGPRTLSFQPEENQALTGQTTNNISEYNVGIEILLDRVSLGIRVLVVKLDSQLIVLKLNNHYSVRNPQISCMYLRVRLLERNFDYMTYQHIIRNLNTLLMH